MARRFLVITGATATGKTALAVAVAQALDGEVVSMDSRQVYRGMDVGTAKPAPAERGGVPHHGFDLVGPHERYSAGRFARDARRWIDEIRARDHVPILAGGTGFFLRALTEPLFEEPPLPQASREALRRWLRLQPTGMLRRWAVALDPGGAVAHEPGNRQRLARSIEVALLSGRRLSEWHARSGGEPGERPLVFVLEVPRPELTRRIDDRVTAMLETGLVAEVAALVARGHGPDDPGMSATGYAELLPHLRGECTLEAAAQRIRSATRRYARRQATWFRNQLPAGVIHLDGTRPQDELTRKVVEEWRSGD